MLPCLAWHNCDRPPAAVPGGTVTHNRTPYIRTVAIDQYITLFLTLPCATLRHCDVCAVQLAAMASIEPLFALLYYLYINRTALLLL